MLFSKVINTVLVRNQSNVESYICEFVKAVELLKVIYFTEYPGTYLERGDAHTAPLLLLMT